MLARHVTKVTEIKAIVLRPYSLYEKIISKEIAFRRIFEKVTVKVSLNPSLRPGLSSKTFIVLSRAEYINFEFLFSEMDLQVALIGVIIFVVCLVILLFVSTLITKEKSYEEAIAEQRQQVNSLLGQNKPKQKDTKKQKKAGKKMKEKQAKAEKETGNNNEDSESTSVETATPEHQSGVKHANLHVEFKEPQVIDVETQKEPSQIKVRRVLTRLIVLFVNIYWYL